MRKVVLITIIALIGGPVEQSPVKAQSVSLIQLIARPADFEGQLVEVVGYVTTSFEDEAIFVNPEDYENGVFENSVKIALEIGQKMPLESDQYAVVVGVVHAKRETRNTRGGVAEIDSITKLEPWFLSKKEVAKRKAKTGGCLWWW
jgi:hypothetical protein